MLSPQELLDYSVLFEDIFCNDDLVTFVETGYQSGLQFIRTDFVADDTIKGAVYRIGARRQNPGKEMFGEQKWRSSWIAVLPKGSVKPVAVQGPEGPILFLQEESNLGESDRILDIYGAETYRPGDQPMMDPTEDVS